MRRPRLSGRLGGIAWREWFAHLARVEAQQEPAQARELLAVAARAQYDAAQLAGGGRLGVKRARSAYALTWWDKDALDAIARDGNR